MLKLLSFFTLISLLNQSIPSFEIVDSSLNQSLSTFCITNENIDGDVYFQGDLIHFDLKIKGMNLPSHSSLYYKIVAFTPEGKMMRLESDLAENNRHINTFVEIDPNVPLKKIGIQLQHEYESYYFILDPLSKVDKVLNINKAKERHINK